MRIIKAIIPEFLRQMTEKYISPNWLREYRPEGEAESRRVSRDRPG